MSPSSQQFPEVLLYGVGIHKGSSETCSIVNGVVYLAMKLAAAGNANTY